MPYMPWEVRTCYPLRPLPQAALLPAVPVGPGPVPVADPDRAPEPARPHRQRGGISQTTNVAGMYVGASLTFSLTSLCFFRGLPVGPRYSITRQVDSPGPPLVCVRPFVTMKVGVARTEGSGLHRLIVQILPAHQCLRSLGSHCLTPASGKHACLPAASSSLPLPAIAPVCLSTSSQTVVHQPLVHLWPPMFSLPGYRTDRACQPASSTSIQRRSGPKSRGSRVCLLLHLLLLCHQLQPVTAAGSEARVVNPTAGFTEGVSALRPISDSAPKPSGIPPSSPMPSQAVSRYVKRSYRRACQRALRQGSTTYRGRLLEARQVPHHLRSSSSCSQYPTTPCAACCQTGAPGLLLERRRTWRRTLCRADDVSNQFPIRCCHHS